MAKDDWITTTEAAEISGYHVEYIRKILQTRKVKGQKWGREWQVSRSSLLAHIRKAEKLGAKRGPKTPA
jgi:excisionase family DNA binding protein